MSDPTVAEGPAKFKMPPGWTKAVKHPNGLYSYEFGGRLLRTPHVTVAPYRQNKSSWTAVVVESNHPSYPVGGYDIVVSDEDLGAAEIIDVSRPFPADHHLRQTDHLADWNFTCDHEPGGRWMSMNEDGTPESDECWLKSWWDEVGFEMVSDDFKVVWPKGPVVAVEPEPGQWDEAPVLVPAGTESSRPLKWKSLNDPNDPCDQAVPDGSDGALETETR